MTNYVIFQFIYTIFIIVLVNIWNVIKVKNQKQEENNNNLCLQRFGKLPYTFRIKISGDLSKSIHWFLWLLNFNKILFIQLFFRTCRPQYRARPFGTIPQWEYTELAVTVFFWDLFWFRNERNRRNSGLFGIHRIAGNRVLLAIVARLLAGKLRTQTSSVSSP